MSKKMLLLFIVSGILIFTGCEAGLTSTSSSDDSSETQFSFSDMYSKLNTLQSELDSLKSSQSGSSGSLQTQIDSINAAVSTNSTAISNNETGINRLFLTASPVGTIVPFGGSSVPEGWLLCDGSSRSRSTFSELYSAIGSAWGTADASSFNLPNLTGRFLRGVDSSASTDPNAGTRYNLYTGGNTGATVGTYQVDELESHSHNLRLTGDGTLATGYQNGVGTDSSGLGWYPDRIADTGGSETRPVNAAVNFIIKYTSN
ncbi:MAG: tail fiber protein [bacterium]|nr:tail fiber protein [bacterium]